MSSGADDVWETDQEAQILWNPRHPDVATQQSLNIYIMDLQNQTAPVHSWTDLQLSQSMLTVVPDFKWFSDYKKLYSATAPVRRRFKIVPSLGAFSSGDSVSTRYSVAINVQADVIPADPEATSTTSTSESTTTPSVSILTVTGAQATQTVSASPDEYPDGRSGLSGAAIAGIAVGSAILVLALLLLAFFWYRRRNQRYRGQLLADEDSKSSTFPRSSQNKEDSGLFAATGTRSNPTSPIALPGAAASFGRRSVAVDDIAFTDMGLDRPHPAFGFGEKPSMDSVNLSSIGGDSLTALASGGVKPGVHSFSPVNAAMIADVMRQKLREPAVDILPDDRLLLSDENLPGSDEGNHQAEVARRREIADERMRRELAESGSELKSISRGKTIIRHVPPSETDLSSSLPDDKL
ncbi:hypothetical protein H4R33_000219 [Dimargaris cristalligena]|uniref:Uncharacterized protein n=1 Tax=Dimargaris cristalligena TaxID=215637 RepID=A0A4P9ZZR1_9FUNG|nr:hypothetical protein H4R33_000219 [Dimargaris cristalligena]RKP38621.1 hypothetical protein BJ085DRAFT_41173 [Dimargaris cristalligena]|eukprot:RKP38621.1 hypothetical protein BJ085DRAFT_41173 [Dimargaris cristalligena]